MENQDPMFEEDAPASQAKAWIQENLRILVSVFIVAAIAFGIYSYSQRSQNTQDNSALLDTKGSETQTTTNDSENTKDTSSPTTGTMKQNVTATPDSSRETETSFVEQAGRGDGATHLARRALANYLEKNTDSSLTAEHKVYIEDYLRKHVAFRGSVHTGTSIEFSKTLIQQAIEKSKTLNSQQLQHLKKYSARVSAYR